PGAQAGDLALHQRIGARQLAVDAARRIDRPMRRFQPLDAAALLVDQHRGVDQGANLVRRVDVAGEEDETPGLHVAEEGGLFAAQRRARAAEDAGAGAHLTKQAFPAAFSLAQKAAASVLLAKPVTAV